MSTTKQKSEEPTMIKLSWDVFRFVRHKTIYSRLALSLLPQVLHLFHLFYSNLVILPPLPLELLLRFVAGTIVKDIHEGISRFLFSKEIRCLRCIISLFKPFVERWIILDILEGFDIIVIPRSLLRKDGDEISHQRPLFHPTSIRDHPVEGVGSIIEAFPTLVGIKHRRMGNMGGEMHRNRQALGKVTHN